MKGRKEAAITNSQECEAIGRAQRGDANAFERLYRLHSSRVFALCLRMVKNTAEAEDLMQETFLSVFRAIRTFRGQSAFSSWLHRVTVNCALMRLRRTPSAPISLEQFIESCEDSGRPGKELHQCDLRLKGLIDRLCIEKAIAQLPAGLKRIFVLYELYGWEHGEIAEILNCSAGTCKGQLHRARRRLRELLPRYQPNKTQGEVQLTG